MSELSLPELDHRALSFVLLLLCINISDVSTRLQEFKMVLSMMHSIRFISIAKVLVQSLSLSHRRLSEESRSASSSRSSLTCVGWCGVPTLTIFWCHLILGFCFIIYRRTCVLGIRLARKYDA